MRNLFFLLLLLNLCLGLWVYSQEREGERQAQAAQPQLSGKSLVLLSELPPGQLENIDVPAPVKPKIELARIESSVESEPKGDLGLATEPAIPEEKDIEPVAETPSEATNEDTAVAELEVLAPPLACYTMGPLSSKKHIASVKTAMSSRQLEYSQRDSQEQVPYGYRVYIPPLSNKETAYRVASELRDAGVKDYFVITNPNDKVNGISLGLFSLKTGALKRVARMRNLNYQASIEVRYKDKDIVWLDFQLEPSRLPEPLFKEALEGVEDVQFLPRDC